MKNILNSLMALCLFAASINAAEQPAERKMFLSLSPVIDVQLFAIPMQAFELKFGHSISKGWHLVIPVRLYWTDISVNDSVSTFFDISSGLGARWHTNLLKFGSNELEYFIEPSVRAGYNSWLTTGAWVGAYLQSGLNINTASGLVFGLGFGMSSGAYLFDRKVIFTSGNGSITSTFTPSRGFIAGELFGTLGYCW